MAINKRILSGVLAVALMGAPLVLAAPGGKTLQFTTESDEAKKLVADIYDALEAFKPGAELQQLIGKLATADPDFAFGVMISSFLQPPPQGLETVKKALEMAANATEGERLYIQATLHQRNQELDKSIEVFAQLARKLPKERRVHMMLGQLNMGQGNNEQARKHFKKAYKLDSSTARIHSFLGNIHLLEGQPKKARRQFDMGFKKVASGSMPFGLHTGRIFSAMHAGDIDGALKNVDALMSNYVETGGPQNFPPVFVWNMKARICLENDRPEEALKYYEKGLESIKDTQAAAFNDQQRVTWTGRFHHGQGRTLAKMGRHEAAWEQCQKVKAMIDEGGDQGQQFLPAYHYLAGYVRLENNEYDKAVAHLEQAAAADPFQQLLLARAYLKTGQNEKARQVLKKVADFSQLTMERALSHDEAVKTLKKLS